MNSKRMAKNKHRHKKANAAAATEKKKAGGRKIFSTVFQPEASSGLSLKSADKHLILEALDELYALRSAREGGTAGDAPAEGQGDTSRSKKKPKPRKKSLGLGGYDICFPPRINLPFRGRSTHSSN